VFFVAERRLSAHVLGYAMDISRKPSWLRAKLPSGPGYTAVRKLVDEHRLHTVCQSAQCPNLGECWSRVPPP